MPVTFYHNVKLNEVVPSILPSEALKVSPSRFCDFTSAEFNAKSSSLHIRLISAIVYNSVFSAKHNYSLFTILEYFCAALCLLDPQMMYKIFNWNLTVANFNYIKTS